MTTANPIHVAARKRVTRQVKALTNMLHNHAIANTFHCGYLAGAGEIISVRRFGNRIHITIDSFDEPPERSILRLQPVTAAKGTDQ